MLSTRIEGMVKSIVAMPIRTKLSEVQDIQYNTLKVSRAYLAQRPAGSAPRGNKAWRVIPPRNRPSLVLSALSPLPKQFNIIFATLATIPQSHGSGKLLGWLWFRCFCGGNIPTSYPPLLRHRPRRIQATLGVLHSHTSHHITQ
jgi:hypothetical protein